LLFVAIAVSQRSPGKRRAPGALLSIRFRVRPSALPGLLDWHRFTYDALDNLKSSKLAGVKDQKGSEWTTPFPHRRGGRTSIGTRSLSQVTLARGA